MMMNDDDDDNVTCVVYICISCDCAATRIKQKCFQLLLTLLLLPSLMLSITSLQITFKQGSQSSLLPIKYFFT